jgi:NAD(P)-dependent dehydrogenase (short-subunit alcohol dehydrogenase family)
MALIKSAVVLGVGSEKGLGTALAKRFAAEGLHVFIAGRSEDKLQTITRVIQDKGGVAIPIVTDATVEHDVIRLFDSASSDDYQLTLAVYNVDSNISSPLMEMSVDTFSLLWRQNCLGGFLFGREAVRRMISRKQGTVFFTGATASLRTTPPFTAFAAAKGGLRALAQGMAREFCSQGIHVILDGVIDGERARKHFAPLVKVRGENGLLHLNEIVETYWEIHRQHLSAWTHELDLRPFSETF